MTNSTTKPVVFYIVAHPDDWIYFTSSIFYDVQNVGKNPETPGKLVIVYVTSGDGGESRPDEWWQAREEGAKAATRFLASISSMRNSSPNVFDRTESQSQDGTEYRFGVTKSHFLRVPDNQIQNLLDGIPQTTVDGRIRNIGKEDLYRKLNSIIEDERDGSTNFCINTLSDREHEGTQENPDHIAVGKAIKATIDRFHATNDCTVVLWHAYSNADKTANPVVPLYKAYPVNIDSHVYFDLLVWQAIALGAYSAKIQEAFPGENGLHLYLSEALHEYFSSVQWLSHTCIEYVYPGTPNPDDFYLGCRVDP
jgi:LmbE family N-acetylglucosaminyl deacetylase